MLALCCSSFHGCPGRPEDTRAQSVSVQAQDVPPMLQGPVQAGDVGSGQSLAIVGSCLCRDSPSSALPCPEQQSTQRLLSSQHVLPAALSSLSPHSNAPGHCFSREMLSSPFLLVPFADADALAGSLSIPGLGLESQNAPGAESGKLVVASKIIFHTGQQQKGGLSQG